MDASTTLTATQMVLVCILLGLLLAWMITFAVLAFRPFTMDTDTVEELAVPPSSPPITSAPTMLHMVASPSLPAETENKRHDTSGEMEIISI